MSSPVPPDPATIEAHLADLRRSYVEAHPKQRLNVGKQRINNPDHDPNRLIAFVSAAEGFARSLCMHQHATTKAELSALYPKFERRGTKSLIAEYLNKKGLGNPSDHFGAETWQLFGYAVEYRTVFPCLQAQLDQLRHRVLFSRSALDPGQRVSGSGRPAVSR